MAFETLRNLFKRGASRLAHAPKRPHGAATGFGVTTSDPAYDAAGSGRRSSSWNPGATAINALLMASGDVLLRKSRQLVRNNAWAASAVESWVANAIGTGIVPTSMHPDPAIKRRIEEAWLRWTDEADADGLQDFYGLQQLAARMMWEAGEAFVRIRPRRTSDGLSVPIQIQMLEAEQLPLWKNEDLPAQGAAPRGNRIRAGIEFDLLGRRVAYHFYPENPYAGAAAIVDDNNLQPVPSWLVNPAAGALHHFQPLRAGQLRGQPRLTPVLTKLYELDQYDDATLSKQKNLSFFMLLIKRLNTGLGIMNEAADAQGEAEVVMEPNTLQYLAPDEEAQEIGGKAPGSEYETFLSVQLHSIATAIGLTYEQLSGDLKGVTYSSIRQGVLEFRRRCEQWQHNVMVFQFCRPIWRSWMDRAVLSGALTLPGYASDPWPYLAVEWTPPAWPWVDPETEVNAAIKEVRAGFNTRSDVCKTKGTDRSTVDRKQAEDAASQDAAGLKYDSDGRQAASGAPAPAAPARDGRPQNQDEQGTGGQAAREVIQ